MNEIKKSPLWSPVVLGMINYWSLTGMVVIDALLVSNMKKILLQVKRDARVERIRFLGSQSQCWQFSPLLWSSLPGDMRGIYSEENNNCREYFHWKYHISLCIQLGKNHVCVILSIRGDTVTKIQYCHTNTILFHRYLTLSAMGGARPSILWGGGQFDPHFSSAPGGLLGHNSFNFNHYTV